MTTTAPLTKPEIADAALQVTSYKHAALLQVQAAIVRVAMARQYVAPGDVPEAVAAPENRQGVTSNAWNVLRTARVLERLPMNCTIEELGIIGGRRRNPQPGAKGRWTAVYQLTCAAIARTWAARNGLNLQERGPVQATLDL